MRSVRLDFDPNVYRLAAVKKAAYRLGSRCTTQIEAPADGKIHVILTARTQGDETADLEAVFRNEVLDQELRETIAQETEHVRNLLLAQAFSGVSLVDDIGESADFRADPLGIGTRPDE